MSAARSGPPEVGHDCWSCAEGGEMTMLVEKPHRYNTLPRALVG